jgi:hypothetical protein
MLAKKTSKNQLTLPKEIVKEFPEIIYFDVSVNDRKIILTPVNIRPQNESLSVIQDKIKKLGISETAVKDAIAWTRKRKK